MMKSIDDTTTRSAATDELVVTMLTSFYFLRCRIVLVNGDGMMMTTQHHLGAGVAWGEREEE